MADGVDIKGWKVPSLPYLVWAPIDKLPKEKGIIRSLKNLAKKADSIVIGTDFDREGELIGSDALRQMRMVAPDTPVSRARASTAPAARRICSGSCPKSCIAHGGSSGYNRARAKEFPSP